MIDLPTPETDAVAEKNIYGVACKVDVDFARKLERERDEARVELEEYRSIAENIGAEKAVSEKEKAIFERNEAIQKYDNLVVENMLEINKICNQRDGAINALMKIEDIFIDGCDTYEDWKRMGQIARTFLEKTYESRTN